MSCLRTRSPYSECVKGLWLGTSCQERSGEALAGGGRPAGTEDQRGLPARLPLENLPSHRSCSMQCAENAKFLVRASYLEIYNEDIRDLLGADTKQKLEVRRSQCVSIRKRFNLHSVLMMSHRSAVIHHQKLNSRI